MQRNLSSQTLDKNNLSRDNSDAGFSLGVDQANRSSIMKSTAGFGFLKRQLSGNVKSKQHKESLLQQDLNVQSLKKSNLKRAGTDMQGIFASRIKQGPNSKIRKLSKFGNQIFPTKPSNNDLDSLKSYDTSKFKEKGSQPRLTHHISQAEIHKSKELLNILRIGAFKQKETPAKQEATQVEESKREEIKKLSFFRNSPQVQMIKQEFPNNEIEQALTPEVRSPYKVNHVSQFQKYNERISRLSSNQPADPNQLPERSPPMSFNTSLVSQNQFQQFQKSNTLWQKNKVKNLIGTSSSNTRRQSVIDDLIPYEANGESNRPNLRDGVTAGLNKLNLLAINNKDTDSKGKLSASKLPRSATLAVKKKYRKKDTKQDQMTIQELKDMILSEKSKVKLQKKLLKKSMKEKAKLENELNNSKIKNCCFWLKPQNLKKLKYDSDDISSDDCKENAKAFRLMKEEEKQEHLTQLWRKCTIKSIAGASVLMLFNDLAKKIYLFGLSNGYNQIERDQHIPPYILLPTDRFRLIWNIINIFLLLYTAIFIPYKVAFVDNDNVVSQGIDWFIDGLYYIDIVLTFISAQENLDGSLELRLPRIAINYLKSNFILDVLACFPFQLINEDSSGGSYQKLLRLMRLPRLFKLLRIVKVLKQVKFLQENQTFNNLLKKLRMNIAITRMIQGMSASLIITHLFACFWFMSSKFDDFDPDTWVVRSQMLDEENINQYLLSLYWASQTVITVGFGDFPAVTAGEMVLCLFWMVFGVGFYSFIIGNYSSIIQSNIQIQASIQQRIKSLAELSKRAQLPIDLAKRVKKFIENNYESIYNQTDEAQLITMLPPSLRDEVYSNTYGEIIQAVEFFREMKDPDFLWRILPLLRPIKLEKGDVLYWRGDHAEDIYFIMKGSIRLYTSKGYPFIKYSEGQFFGDSDTLLNLPRDGKAIAMTHLKLMVLKIDHMFESSFENQEKNLMSMIFNARKKRNIHLRMIKQANKKHKNKKKYTILQKRTWHHSAAMDISTAEDNGHKMSTGENQLTTQQDTSYFGNLKNKIANLMKPTTPRGNQSSSKNSFLSFIGIKKSEQTKNTEGLSPTQTKSINTETEGHIGTKTDLKNQMSSSQVQNKFYANQNSNLISAGFQHLEKKEGSLSIEPIDDGVSRLSSIGGGASPAHANFRSISVGSLQLREPIKDMKMGTQLSVIVENETNFQNTPVKPLQIKTQQAQNQQLQKQHSQDMKKIKPLNLGSGTQTKAQLKQQASKESQNEQSAVREVSENLASLLELQNKKESAKPKASILDKMLSQVFKDDEMKGLKNQFGILKRMNEDAIVEKSESYLTESDIATSSGYKKPDLSWRERRNSLNIAASMRKDKLLDDSDEEQKQFYKSKKNSSFQLNSARQKKIRSIVANKKQEGNLQMVKTNENDRQQSVSSLTDDESIRIVDEKESSPTLNTRSGDISKAVIEVSPFAEKYKKAITRINEDIEFIESQKISEVNIQKNLLGLNLQEENLSHIPLTQEDSRKQNAQLNLNFLVNNKKTLQASSAFLSIVNQSRTKGGNQAFEKQANEDNKQAHEIKSNTLGQKDQLKELSKNQLSPSIIPNILESRTPTAAYNLDKSPLILQRNNKSFDPTPQAQRIRAKAGKQKDAHSRTSSMRVVVSRPSIMVIKQNLAEGIANEMLGQRNQFISPISLQRIHNIDGLISRDNTSQASWANDTSIKKQGKSPNRGQSFSLGKRSLQEAVSFVFEHRSSLRQNTGMNLVGKFGSGIKTPAQVNLAQAPLQSKQTFSEAVEMHKNNRKQSLSSSRKGSAKTIEENKSQLIAIDAQNRFLDDHLLNDQVDEAPIDYTNILQEQQVSGLRQTLVEEIQRRFSKNIDKEYRKLQSDQESLSPLFNNNQYIDLRQQREILQQTSSSYLNLPSLQNYPSTQPSSTYHIISHGRQNSQSSNMTNQQIHAGQYLNFDKINSQIQPQLPLLGSNRPELTHNLSSLQYNESSLKNGKANSRNQEELKEKRDAEEDEQIEFYGDPAMTGMVQFNADMSHIALNIFETFTLFDLIGKNNAQINESVEIIKAQENIIEHRQSSIDYQIDQMENKFELIKQLQAFNQEHNQKLVHSFNNHQHTVFKY